MTKTKMSNLIILIVLIFSGLMAGLFFAFTVAVMPGLSKLPDSHFLSAMQSINLSIQNPVFFLVFMGILLALPAGCVVYYRQATDVHFWLFLAGTIIYFIGVFAVTAAGNIPLNNTLDAFVVKGASPESLAAARDGFENKWNNLNIVRTICSIASFIFLLLASKS